MTEPLRWLAFADEDLILAEAALERKIYNQVCFHSQQGVEKALKAFIRSKQRSVPRTHFLSELTKICSKLDSSFTELEKISLSLDRYYIPTRYPDALPGSTSEGLPTLQDAKEALTALKTVLDSVQVKISK